MRTIGTSLKAREACVVPSHTAAEGKNDFRFSSPSHTQYTSSSLVPAHHQFIERIGNSKRR